ncbi:hypothetical protein N665_0426s0002 [Sinapis alba]|nr:hypothetical protein N665_0426s0002 [Sinapis alba]
MRFSEFYPGNFSHMEWVTLEHQLGVYIDNIYEHERTANLKDFGDLACIIVETKKHLLHPQVYRFLKLVLILYVATATVERCFPAMKIKIFEKVTNDVVIKRFQKIESHRINL